MDLDTLIASALDEAAALDLPAKKVKRAVWQGPAKKAPNWTEKEKRFLEDNIGRLSFQEIGDHLGRSATGVKIKQVRYRLPAPSKHPGYLTARRAADALGVDIHAVTTWHDRGIFTFERVPLSDRKIYRTKFLTLLLWVGDPMNFIYFRYDLHHRRRHIPHPVLRWWVETCHRHWGDDWWTTRQAGDYLGVSHGLVNKLVRHGEIPAVKYGNWKIRRSVVFAFKGGRNR